MVPDISLENAGDALLEHQLWEDNGWWGGESSTAAQILA